MKLLLLLPILVLTACTTINVEAQGDVIIDAHKDIKTDTAAGV